MSQNDRRHRALFFLHSQPLSRDLSPSHLNQSPTWQPSCLAPDRCLPSCRTSLIALDIKFRGLHLNNANILSGTQITAAYLDLNTNKLHLISNGGCRAVVGARRPGIPDVIVELGRPQFSSPRAAVSSTTRGVSSSTDSSTTSAATQLPAPIRRAPSENLSESSQLPAKMASGASLLPAGMTTVQLTEDVESIVLGSTGLWCALLSYTLS